ncbi:MAG: hypothetical protein ACI9U2_001618 [Bradymonadia bacterium]
MIWIALGAVGLIALIVGLGHLRLKDRQADVAAARRQIEALIQARRETHGDDRRAILDGRLAATHRLYTAELARYQATHGARINRWQPKALPHDDA